VLAVTLSRSRPDLVGMPGAFHYEEPFCLMSGFSINGGFEFLNVLVFMPFEFFAVLATRRPFVVLAVCVVMSAVIELVQTLTGQGACETQDFLNSSLGAVVAAGLAAVVNVFLSRVSPPVDAGRVDGDATR
jgi:glycopeptide antibiotics resistance protein